MTEAIPRSPIPRSLRPRLRTIFSTSGLIRSRTGLRDRVREFIQVMFEGELEAALSRPRYARLREAVERRWRGRGLRQRSPSRPPVAVTVGKLRPTGNRGAARQAEHCRWQDDGVAEPGAASLPAPHAGCRRADCRNTTLPAPIRAVCGVHSAPLFNGAVGKDTVSRVWRKVKSDWDAWNARSLAEEPIVRLILDGTSVRVRLDRKATSISLLVVIGVRANGQKVLLAIKSMGSESTEAWRTVLDDLITRGLRAA